MASGLYVNRRVDLIVKMPKVKGAPRTIQFQDTLMVSVMHSLPQMVRTSETYLDFGL